MPEHDLVVRGGTVIDGTGSPARTADVATTDGVDALADGGDRNSRRSPFRRRCR